VPAFPVELAFVALVVPLELEPNVELELPKPPDEPKVPVVSVADVCVPVVPVV
jgi:hypothetical protein